MIETWRVIKEITQEEVEVDYQEDISCLTDDFMTKFEDMENTNDFDAVDSKRGEYALPDLISRHEEDLNSSETENKLSPLSLLPDLVVCCQAAGGADQTGRTRRSKTRQSDPIQCRDMEEERRLNSGDSARVPRTQSPEKDDLCKLDHGVLPLNSPNLMIPGKTAQDESKSSWAQTGRLLARMAEQATDKSRSLDTRKHSGGREEGDADNPDYHHRRHTLTQPSAQHSNLMSNLALCGISYLVKL